VGKIAEKAVCKSVFLTIWHCILSAEITKMRSFRDVLLAVLPTGLLAGEKSNLLLWVAVLIFLILQMQNFCKVYGFIQKFKFSSASISKNETSA